MSILSADKASGVIGPYSQGYEVDGAVYTSKQIPVNPADGIVAEGTVAQTKQSYKNMGAILKTAGTGFDRVFRTTCFLTDTNGFDVSNEAYAKYFMSRPARSCMAVKTLPKGVLYEAKAIVVK